MTQKRPPRKTSTERKRESMQRLNRELQDLQRRVALLELALLGMRCA
jgi:hypothetical protein